MTATGADAGAGEANTGYGINLLGSNNTIGGTTAADRNVIAGNVDGIYVQQASGNVIVGNYIGTDGTGLLDLGNTDRGIQIESGSDNTTIGGNTASARNVISGNNSDGIIISDGASPGTGTTGTIVEGNYIGVGADGVTALGNSVNGVRITTESGHRIGGTAAGAGNIIAYNTGDGVQLQNSTAVNNAILGNSIFSNGGEGIDLGNDSVTANDVGDGDTGANNLQNFPVLTSANSNTIGTSITGSFNSNANTGYRIEFYANRPSLADTPNGEGERYLGFVDVTTDGSGNATINTTLANVWINSGDRVTATAIVDLGAGNFGSTSEFAANVSASSSGIIVVDTTSGLADGTTSSITNLGNARGADGRISLLEAVLAANNTANGGSPDKIVFNIPATDANHLYYRDNAVAGTFAAPVVTALSDFMITDFDADYVAATARAWYRITLGSSDLNVTQALIIDGSTQAGYDAAKGPVIEINAVNVSVGDPNAISLTTGASTIRALVINRAGDNGIEVDAGADGSVLVGNYLGTDVSGTQALGNSTDGPWGAVGIKADNVVVGGAAPADRNLISGNAGSGIEIYNSATGALIQGNYIGLSASGTGTLGNAGPGIDVHDDAASNTIGGTGANQGNRIASNGGDGVWLQTDAGAGNLLLGNLIYSNVGLGIDLGANGTGLNDPGDGDSGANNLQNFPLLSSAISAAGNTTISGSLNSNPATTYRIEFFSSPTGDASGNGEGRVFLGFTTVTTDGSGNASIAALLTGTSVTAGHVVTATATVDLGGGNYGSTSEFGPNVIAASGVPGITVGAISANTTEAGGTASFSVVLDTAPTSDVTIAVSSSNTLEGTVSTVLLTFTSANWNLAQTVTVSGINESIIDGNRAYMVVLGSASSADLAYGGLNPADVSVTNIDDDIRSTIVVTTSGDAVDGNTSNLYALLANQGADGSISLREAIIASNNTINGPGGADRIHFAIAGAGVQTINLASALPWTTDPVVIDASTQPGYAGTPLIELNGTAAGAGVDGLRIDGGSSTVRGLVINNFSGNGVYLSSAGGNTVVGNYIGTSSNGASAAANNTGIFIANNSFNTIGGTSAVDRNLISANAGYGVYIWGSGTSNNRVAGNYIGTDASGAGALGNGFQGVALDTGADNNLIGGTTAGSGNLIAHNGFDGIALASGAGNGNAILGNMIFANGNLAIDLQDNGVTLNDAGDVDAGVNNLQNFPVLATAVTTGAQITITGSISSAANSFYRIEFFASTLADGSGYGEAETFLGFANVATDGAGLGNFNPMLTVSVAAGASISATATLSNAAFNTFTDTSEFAQNITASVGGNTAPVLDSSRSPALAAVVEDAGAPVGSVGTMLSDLVDFAIPAGQLDNVSDPDGGALLGIAVTAADIANGSWFYSIDAGGVWNPLGAVTSTSARLLAADANTRVYFQPNADYNGTLSAALSFRAWDQTSGTNGGVADTSANGGTSAFSATTDTASLLVSEVNDAPVNAIPVAQNTGEDTALVFSIANGNPISIGDVDAGAGSVQLTLNASNGTITLAGTTGLSFGLGDGTADANMSFTGTLVDINAALDGLSFLPSANFNGSASLQIVSNDLGNSGSGGPLGDTDNVSITVNGINDAPTLTIPAAQSVNEDLILTLSGANAIVVADIDAGAAVAQFTISAGNGLLSLSGTAGLSFLTGTGASDASMSFTGTLAAINTALNGLSYQANSNYNGLDVIAISVDDLGNSGAGGAQVANAFLAVTVNPVNDVPVMTGASLTIGEGQTVTLAPADIGITDPDNASFTFTSSAITGGYFQLSSAPGTPITVFTSAQLAGGLVQFVDDGNEVAPSFDLSADDGAANSNTVSAVIAYTPVNDAPLISSAALTLSEGQTVTMAAADFGIVDPDNLSFTYTMSAIAGGYFQLTSAPGTPITVFSSAQLAGGLVQFVDDGNELAPGFSVTVNDGAENSNTLSAAISYTPVNDAPSISSAALTLSEGQTVTLAAADIGITDPDDASFTFTSSAITGGFFQLSSAPGTPITVFTSAQLAGGLVQFVDDGNEVAPSFDLTADDGAANSNTVSAVIAYTPVNDAPLISSAALTLSEGQTVTMAAADFGITDPDNASFTYTMSAIAGGFFQLSSAPGTPITVFTIAQLAGGLVQFVDDGNELAPGFSVTVNDGAANSNTLSATISYTPVNDAPTIGGLAGDTLGYAEGDGTVLIEQGGNAAVVDLDSTDFGGGSLTVSLVAGSNPAEDVLSIRNEGLGAGQIGVAGANLSYGGVPIGSFAGGSAGAALVVSLNASATPGAVSALLNNVTFTESNATNPTLGGRTARFVLDDGDGGTSSSYDAFVVVSGVNDAPILTSAALTLSEGQTVTLAVADFGIVDPDNLSFTYTMSAIAGGYFQLSSAPGTPITVFSSAQLAGGLVQFVDDGNELAPGFSVTVNDGASNSNSLSAAISYTPVNDAPSISSAALTLSEGQTVTLAAADIGITDPDNASFTFTSSAITGGYFQLSSAPGTPITVFTSAQLSGGVVQFVDDGNEVAPSFDLSADDGAANSNTVSAVIAYTPVNDAPLISSAALTLSEGQTVTMAAADFGIVDPDNLSFTYTMSAIAGGYFQLTSAPGTPITVFSSATARGRPGAVR